jgi:hypothetical protein
LQASDVIRRTRHVELTPQDLPSKSSCRREFQLFRQVLEREVAEGKSTQFNGKIHHGINPKPIFNCKTWKGTETGNLIFKTHNAKITIAKVKNFYQWDL